MPNQANLPSVKVPSNTTCKVWDKVGNIRHSLHQFETGYDIRDVQVFRCFQRRRIYLEHLGGWFAIVIAYSCYQEPPEI